MRRTISLLSALTLTGLGAAIAQEQQPGVQPGEPEQQPGVQPGEQERDPAVAAADRPQSGDFLTQMEQQHIRSDQLQGSDLLDQQDESIGNIEGLVIDQDNGEVAGLLVSVGGVAGVAGRTVAVSWDAVDISRQQDEYEVRTQMSQQEFEDAPEYGQEGDQVAGAEQDEPRG